MGDRPRPGGLSLDPKWTRVIAVVVVVILIVAGIGVYYYLSHQNNCGLKSTNPLVFDQPETPDTLDPAVTFTTPGWGVVQQVYQTLVAYNGSSYTSYVGVLAKNWSESTDGFHYNFTLWPNIHFSNGDPVNAYVMWYSLYRAIAMTQATSFILTENFWYPGLSDYYATADQNANATTNMTNDLNNWNFDTPTAAEIQAMEAPNQSFQVINSQTIELNLGFGYLADPATGAPVSYTYLLSAIAAPLASAVDPNVVDAHGGVNQSTNAWMFGNMVGTGPYMDSQTYSATSTSLTLSADPNYWGAAVASQVPNNNAIQPAKAGVQINFVGTTSILTQDVKTGAAAAGSFAYLGPSQIADLKSSSCVVINALPVVYGATSGSWWVYMNQSAAPFSNWSVRAAVVHAINYTQIIQLGFGGQASQWVGPVPPGYPDYNPGNLSPYAFNLPLAKQEMASSPWPNGYPSALNYEYLNLGDWPEVALLLKDDLAAIGITLNLVSVSNVPDLIALQGIDPSSPTSACVSQESPSTVGGPFPIGQEFYTSDYISPDDWTQNDALSAAIAGYGSANACMSGYANATADELIISAAGEHNPANLTRDYSQLTQMMYNNYTDAWLAVPTSYQVYNSQLQGIISNPMASGLPFVMFYNSESAT